MTFTEAAYMILKDARKPLHSREIVEIALNKRLLGSNGKTPWSTMWASLYLENKRREKRGIKPRFVRQSKAVWGLTEWESK
jgi:hypothetical protein